MVELDAAALERLKRDAQRVDERMARGAAGGALAKYVSLFGQNALCPPGGEVIVRLLPRWDIANKVRRSATGQVELNPDYKGGSFYEVAWEHWWDGPDGKRRRAWCIKTLGEDHPCPLCEAAAQLQRGPKEDKEEARNIQAKEVYLFNVIVRKDPYGEDGRPAIKILAVPPTVFRGISRYMMGGEEQADWARGDISHPKEGYDIKIIRPGGAGDRYKTDCAPKPSSLFTPDQADRWKGWVSLLHNLEEETSPPNVLSYGDLYREFWGREPEGGAVLPPDAGGFDSPAGEVPGSETGWDPEGGGFDAPPPVAEGGELADFDPGFNLPGEPAASAPPPVAQRTPPSRPAPPPSRSAPPSGGRRPSSRGGRGRR